jgi:hypothetical protein
MSVKAVSLLTAVSAMALIALDAPLALAQRNGGPRNNGTFVGNPQALPQQQPRRAPLPLSNTLILPMSNPIEPMRNPIAPIVSPPFVRYSDPIPTVVVPERSRPGRGDYGRRGGRDVIYVPVAVPYYGPYDTYYDPSPVLEPEPVIPGQLPAPINSNLYRGRINSANPETTESAQAESTFTQAPAAATPQPEASPEPNTTVDEPRPRRAVVPPAIGTSRFDVIARFGQPWGTILARGQETLYFDGVTVVFGPDGKVIQTR